MGEGCLSLEEEGQAEGDPMFLPLNGIPQPRLSVLLGGREQIGREQVRYFLFILEEVLRYYGDEGREYQH